MIGAGAQGLKMAPPDMRLRDVCRHPFTGLASRIAVRTAARFDAGFASGLASMPRANGLADTAAWTFAVSPLVGTAHGIA